MYSRGPTVGAQSLDHSSFQANLRYIKLLQKANFSTTYHLGILKCKNKIKTLKNVQLILIKFLKNFRFLTLFWWLQWRWWQTIFGKKTLNFLYPLSFIYTWYKFHMGLKGKHIFLLSPEVQKPRCSVILGTAQKN